jgi:hypothetical protein
MVLGASQSHIRNILIQAARGRTTCWITVILHFWRGGTTSNVLGRSGTIRHQNHSSKLNLLERTAWRWIELDNTSCGTNDGWRQMAPPTKRGQDSMSFDNMLSFLLMSLLCCRRWLLVWYTCLVECWSEFKSSVPVQINHRGTTSAPASMDYRVTYRRWQQECPYCSRCPTYVVRKYSQNPHKLKLCLALRGTLI